MSDSSITTILLSNLPEPERITYVLQKNPLLVTAFMLAVILGTDSAAVKMLESLAPSVRDLFLRSETYLGLSPLRWCCRLNNSSLLARILDTLPASTRHLHIIDDEFGNLLTAAVGTGNTSCFYAMLNALPSSTKEIAITARDEGSTPLQRACELGYLDMVTSLMNSLRKRFWSRYLEQMDNKCYTALMHASEGGHIHIVETLLSYLSEKRGMAYILLRPAFSEETALSLAYRNMNYSMMSFLLQRLDQHHRMNALLTPDYDEGICLLSLACAEGEAQMLALMLGSLTPENRIIAVLTRHPISSSDSTMLFFACESGDPNIVKCILNLIPDPKQQMDYIEIRDSQNQTVVHKACQNGNVTVLTLLLNVFHKHNARKMKLLECHDDDGLTPLLTAIVSQHAELVSLILKQLPTESNRKRLEHLMICSHVYHRNALMTALFAKADSIATMLLNWLPKSERMTLIQHRNSEGNSALMLACNCSSLEQATFLLNELPSPEMRSAYVLMRNHQSETTLMYATRSGSPELISLLLSSVACPKQRAQYVMHQCRDELDVALFWAVHNPSSQVIPMLLECIPDPTDRYNFIMHRNSRDFTPLMLAVSQGMCHAVRSLLDPLPPHSRIEYMHRLDQESWNALMIACQKGHLEVVKLLLSYLPTSDAKLCYIQEVNAAGATALMICSLGGHYEIASYLLESIDPDSRASCILQESSRGLNSLMLAAVTKDARFFHTLTHYLNMLSLPVGLSTAVRLALSLFVPETLVFLEERHMFMPSSARWSSFLDTLVFMGHLIIRDPRFVLERIAEFLNISPDDDHSDSKTRNSHQLSTSSAQASTEHPDPHNAHHNNRFFQNDNDDDDDDYDMNGNADDNDMHSQHSHSWSDSSSEGRSSIVLGGRENPFLKLSLSIISLSNRAFIRIAYLCCKLRLGLLTVSDITPTCHHYLLQYLNQFAPTPLLEILRSKCFDFVPVTLLKALDSFHHHHHNQNQPHSIPQLTPSSPFPSSTPNSSSTSTLTLAPSSSSLPSSTSASILTLPSTSPIPTATFFPNSKLPSSSPSRTNKNFFDLLMLHHSHYERIDAVMTDYPPTLHHNLLCLNQSGELSSLSIHQVHPTSSSLPAILQNTQSNLLRAPETSDSITPEPVISSQNSPDKSSKVQCKKRKLDDLQNDDDMLMENNDAFLPSTAVECDFSPSLSRSTNNNILSSAHNDSTCTPSPSEAQSLSTSTSTAIIPQSSTTTSVRSTRSRRDVSSTSSSRSSSSAKRQRK